MSSKSRFIMGGLLSGIGQGMAAQAQQSAVERREMALQTLRGQQAQEAAGAAHHAKMAEMQTDADLRDRNDARANERKTSSTITIDNNKSGHAITLEKLKASNNASLERLQSTLRMNETQAELAQKLANDVTLAGKEAGEFRVKEDGTMVVLSKSGTVLNKSEPGAFIPTRVSRKDGDEGGGGTISGAMATRGGAPAAASKAPPAPRPQQPVNPQWHAPNYSPSQDPKVIRLDAKGNIIK